MQSIRDNITAQNLAPFLVELVGTFFFVMVIGLNLGQGTQFASITIGVMLMIIIYSGGHISGGHFNPSVTIGVLMGSREPIERKDIFKALAYIFLQICGGVVGALVAVWLTDSSITPTPSSSYRSGSVFMLEVFFTFLLVSVVLNTATTKSQVGNSFYGAAIGLTVFVGASSVGSISGGVFNPAVATGASLASAFIKGSYFGNLWLYWLAHLLASPVSAIFFRLVNSREGYTLFPCMKKQESDFKSFKDDEPKEQKDQGHVEMDPV
jgi:aquaporin Z